MGPGSGETPDSPGMERAGRRPPPLRDPLRTSATLHFPEPSVRAGAGGNPRAGRFGSTNVIVYGTSSRQGVRGGAANFLHTREVCDTDRARSAHLPTRDNSQNACVYGGFPHCVARATRWVKNRQEKILARSDALNTRSTRGAARRARVVLESAHFGISRTSPWRIQEHRNRPRRRAQAAGAGCVRRKLGCAENLGLHLALHLGRRLLFGNLDSHLGFSAPLTRGVRGGPVRGPQRHVSPLGISTDVDNSRGYPVPAISS